MSGVFRPWAMSAARRLACLSAVFCASSKLFTSATNGAISVGADSDR